VLINFGGTIFLFACTYKIFVYKRYLSSLHYTNLWIDNREESVKLAYAASKMIA